MSRFLQFFEHSTRLQLAQARLYIISLAQKTCHFRPSLLLACLLHNLQLNSMSQNPSLDLRIFPSLISSACVSLSHTPIHTRNEISRPAKALLASQRINMLRPKIAHVFTDSFNLSCMISLCLTRDAEIRWEAVRERKARRPREPT